jgi:hypothetical protein
MKPKPNGQELDLSNPGVARFAAQCGIAQNAVSIRLVGVSAEDVQLQIDRLSRAYGPMLAMTRPAQSGKGLEWIAYGTIRN